MESSKITHTSEMECLMMQHMAQARASKKKGDTQKVGKNKKDKQAAEVHCAQNSTKQSGAEVE